MSLYLVVKVVWVAASLFRGGMDGDEEASDWVMINLLTVAMAIVGVGLGLALAQPWGRRLPAAPVLLSSWIACGLLAVALPVAVLKMVVDAATGSEGDRAAKMTENGSDLSMAAWEAGLITIGVAGMGIGVLVALPIYLVERWPHAFAGTLHDDDGVVDSSVTRLAGVATALCAMAGLMGLYWVLGGTAGIDPARREDRDLGWRLVTAVPATWALIGAWGVWTIARARSGVRRYIPTAFAGAASGTLFAWNGWMLVASALSPDDIERPQLASAAGAHQLIGIFAGIATLGVLAAKNRRPNTGRSGGPAAMETADAVGQLLGRGDRRWCRRSGDGADQHSGGDEHPGGGDAFDDLGNDVEVGGESIRDRR